MEEDMDMYQFVCERLDETCGDDEEARAECSDAMFDREGGE